MLLPGEVCTDLTMQTADRLQSNRSFVRFYRMDGSAQGDLTRGLKKTKPEDLAVVGGLSTMRTLLARSILFFARDPDTKLLYSVPWVRSPSGSRSDYHMNLISEFGRAAKERYPEVNVFAPYGVYPDAVAGVATRTRGSATFFEAGRQDIPTEHLDAIERSQKFLAAAGVLLHVQLGGTLFQAGDLPADNMPSDGPTPPDLTGGFPESVTQ